MHLQQAKVGKSGGPQYWLQKAPDHILEHIQRHTKCPVILQTPYGPIETQFNAVDPDHKIVDVEKVVASKARRDQIPIDPPRGATTQYRLEKITYAAVRLTNGHVYTGLFHGNALKKAHRVYAKKSASYYSRLFGKSEDGFITNTGRFVDRDEAYRTAVKSGQITPKSHAEAVQDLWGDTLKKISRK